jgi:cytochrome c oxidase cbb3-type subunit 3
MADFYSSGWSIFIMAVTAVSVVGCFWLTFTLSKGKAPGQQVDTTGHKWDETLEEYNNPLPRWWIWLFYITIVFSIVYLVLYPGFGSLRGSFGWSQVGQYEAEVAKAKATYEPLFAKYLQQDIKQVAADPQAKAMGERLYLTYCVQCHGSDARGSKGFPNLADNDWLWGGDPAEIEKTLLGGRNGVMPPMGAAVGGAADVENVANYVLSLSGSGHDAAKAALGKDKFAACAACHGADGKGNPAMGAPNLTDKTWLYGGSLATVMEGINKGRNNQMPAFKDLLGEGKIRVLAAYVWGLSNTAGKQASSQ